MGAIDPWLMHGQFEEHLCEMILNLGQQFRRCSFKGSGGHFVRPSGTIWTNLLEDLMRYICVKLF